MDNEFGPYNRDAEGNEIYPIYNGTEYYLLNSKGKHYFAKLKNGKEFYTKNSNGDELCMDNYLFITDCMYIFHDGQPVYPKMANRETYYWSYGMSRYLRYGQMRELMEEMYFSDEQDNQVYRKSLKGIEIYAVNDEGAQKYAKTRDGTEIYATLSDTSQVYALDKQGNPYFAVDKTGNPYYAKDGQNIFIPLTFPPLLFRWCIVVACIVLFIVTFTLIRKDL